MSAESRPMATILPFPVEKVVPVWGLTKRECDAVRAEAYDLILRGRVTSVTCRYDRQYMCVFDRERAPYFIGREERVCYLFSPDETLIAQSRRFKDVLEAMDVVLSSDMPA